MRPTKAIFVEGIIGSGKSTTARFLTDYLHQQQIAARFMPEGGRDHPLRVAGSLPHPFQIWHDLTIDQFIRHSRDKWQTFVQAAQPADHLTVFDGQLFHGNMTDLLLLNATASQLHAYVALILDQLRELRPVLIYLYQVDVAATLRRICDTRGSDWEAYQLNWKLPSPYGLQRGLTGFPGLVALYRDYRAISDTIVVRLPIPTLTIDTTDGHWEVYYRDMLTFLDVSVGSG
jgi:deoxyadenosine/deoxycytidine kinase